MVDLSAGPPFPHQPGDAGAVAQGLAGQAANVQALGDSVSSAHAPAMPSVSGIFSAPMATAPRPAQQGVQQLARSTLFAAGALRLFANATEAYNSTIDRLNDEWSTAEGNNFGVAHPYVPGGATPEQASQAQAQYEADVNAARAALRAELRGKQQAAEGRLDDAAAEARGMLSRGPNDADASHLIRLGVFPDLLDETLEGMRGQLVPLDGSLLGLSLFGAGRGLQALDLYAKYMAEAARGAMRFQPRRQPLTFRELRALRADVKGWTRLSSRLLGPAGNLVSLTENIRNDGVVKGTAQTLAGIRGAAFCAAQAAKVAGRSPATLVISSGVAGVACGILGTETTRQIMEDAGEVAEDAVGVPTAEPSRFGMPTLGWDSPQWYEDTLGRLTPG